jgi:hypothetical protein
MRRLRRPGALLALLVTAWSSSTVLPCGAPSFDTPAPTGHAAHVGAGMGREGGHEAHHHGGSGRPDEAGQDGSRGGDAGQSCGFLMACGAGLRGVDMEPLQAAAPPRLDDAPFASVRMPSSADLSQDTPPPRCDA